MRRGRKRGATTRFRNGDLRPLPALTPRQIAATMPHRRGLGDDASIPLAESELGRLFLTKFLTEKQMIAGNMFAVRFNGYMATLEGPRRPDRGSGRGYDCGSCEQPGEDFCLCAVRKREYLNAFRCLSEAMIAPMLRTAVFDQPSIDRKLLLMGLIRLGLHFGLTQRAKRDLGNAQFQNTLTDSYREKVKEPA